MYNTCSYVQKDNLHEQTYLIFEAGIRSEEAKRYHQAIDKLHHGHNGTCTHNNDVQSSIVCMMQVICLM